jgi:hypothetical protein
MEAGPDGKIRRRHEQGRIAISPESRRSIMPNYDAIIIGTGHV